MENKKNLLSKGIENSAKKKEGDNKPRYNPDSDKGNKKPKYYPNPNKEKQNQPVYNPNPDKEKGKVDYKEFMNNLSLERRVGENELDYHERLLAINSTQIELISRYEKEKELDRYRTTNEYFKRLMEKGSEGEEQAVKDVILNLQKEVNSYLANYPELSSRAIVSEKLKDLNSII
jgi:hypothetical protein